MEARRYNATFDHRPSTRTASMSRTLALAAITFALLGASVALAVSPAKLDIRLDGYDPAAVGMEDCRKALTERLEKFIADKQISGAVVLAARKGQTGALVAVGDANIEPRQPMTPDAIFAIASMTKPMTATAMLILQDDGKLSVEDPVSKYIPAFKKVQLKEGKSPARELTIRDLMTHTSGLQSLTGKSNPPPTLAETADQMAALPLQFEPGSKWQYGNGLTVCGRIIEIASGMEYAEFLQKRIFEPLGMKETGFSPTAEQRKRLATLYKPSDDKKSLVATPNFLNPGDSTTKRTPNPSGGLYSTAHDVALFYDTIRRGGALNGTRIVSEAAVKQMTSLQTGELETGFTPGNGWGLGWCLVQKPQGVSRMLSPGSFGHGGAWGTQVWVDPKQELVIVLMIQRSGFGNSDGSDIRDAVQEIVVGAVKK